MKASKSYGQNVPMEAKLLELLVGEMVRRLEEGAAAVTAAEMTVMARLLADNSVTLASVRQGDFGSLAQAAAESFPFPTDED